MEDETKRSSLNKPPSWAIFWIVIFLLLWGLILAFPYLPLSSLAASQITQYLEERGVVVQRLTVDTLSSEAISVSDVKLGDEKSLTLQKATAGFQLDGLELQAITTVQAQGVSLQLYQTPDEAWQVGGVEPLLAGDTQSKPSLFAFPLNGEAWRDTLPTEAKINDASIDINGQELKAQLSLDVSYMLSEDLRGVLALDTANIQTPQAKVTLKPVNAKIDITFGESSRIKAEGNADGADITLAEAETITLGKTAFDATYTGSQIEGELSTESVVMELPDGTRLNADLLKLDSMKAAWEEALAIDINGSLPALSLGLPGGEKVSLTQTAFNASMTGSGSAIDGTSRAITLSLPGGPEVEGDALNLKIMPVSEKKWNIHTGLGSARLTGVPGLSLSSRSFSLDSSYGGGTLGKTRFSGRSLSGNYKRGKDSYTFSSGAYRGDAVWDASQKRWEGNMALDAVKVNGFPKAVPVMNISGGYWLSGDTFYASLHSTGEVSAKVELRIPLSSPGSSTVKVNTMSLPWEGGTLRVESRDWVDIGLNKPINIILAFNNIELAKLAEEIAPGKISASGKLSGQVPVTYDPSTGRITVERGTARAADEGGVLSLSPQVLGGTAQNQNIELASQVLENFHYDELSLQVESDAEENTAISMRIKGSNPEVMGGHPVHLNVNLTGDIVPLIRQSLLPIQDVRRLLELQK